MADGSIVTDVSGGISKLAFSSTLNSSRVAEMREQLSAVQRKARSEELSSGHVTTAAHTNRSGRTTSTESTRGSESASGTQSGDNHELFDRTSNSTYDGIDTRSGVVDSQKIDNGVTRTSQQIDSTQGSLRAGLGANGGSKAAQPSGGTGKGQGQGKKGIVSQVKDALPGVSGSKTWTDNQMWDLKHATGRTVTSDEASNVTDGMRNDHGNGENYAVTDGSYSRGGSFARSARTSTTMVGSDDSLTEAYSHENRLRQLNELAEQLSNDISFAETHNMQFSENLSQELAEWYRQEANRMPPGIAPELHQTTFTAQERQVRDAMISKFLDERSQAIWDTVGPEMKASPLNEIVPPAVSPDEARVRARYHPQGVGSVPTLSGPAGPGDIGAKVAAGKQELEGLGEAKRVMRAGYASKGAAVQSVVNDDMDKGFFNDPNLRK